MESRISVMRCLAPVLVNRGAGEAQRFACGWCHVCMAAHAAEWSTRLQLECLASGTPWVVRLSYADPWLPANGLPSVLDFERGWSRIRESLKAVYGVRVRFYAVAELGELKGRPHYHALVWGLPDWVATDWRPGPRASSIPVVQDVIEEAWRFGQVNAQLARDSGAASGYLTMYFEKGRGAQRAERIRARDLLPPKQLARASQQRRRYLPGERVIWFHRMSPGLSSGVVDSLLSVLSDGVGHGEVQGAGDVPRSVRVGGRSVSLPRYVRRKLRARFGVAAVETPAARVEALEMAARVELAGGVRKLRQVSGHVDADVAEIARRRAARRRSGRG